MFRATHLAYANRVIQVPLQFKSTSCAASASKGAAAADLEWDNALPYSEMPGPKPLPALGNIMKFLPGGEFYGQDSSRLFKTLFKTYGPIVKLSGIMGKPDIVCVSDPDDTARVYRSDGRCPVRGVLKSLDYFFRNKRKHCVPSLLVSEGLEWQEFRTAVNQVMMQPKNTQHYVEPIDRVSQEFIDRMRAVRNHRLEMPPDFGHEISKWALESITLVALDVRLGILRDLQPESEATRMIKAVSAMADSIYALDLMPSPWRLISTPAYRRMVSSLGYITDVSTKYVNLAVKRLEQLPPGGERNLSVLENLLIQTQDPQRAVSMAMDMLMAGIDSTATTVATVAYMLANNPEKQMKLQEELDRLIPDPSTPLKKEQLEEMKYLRACIKETMRMMPLALGLVRTTSKDIVIGGYQVPSGTFTIMVAQQLTSSNAHFPRVNEFLPERWLRGGESDGSGHPFAFLPFGFGPRMCVGRRFADLEIEMLVAKMFRTFSIEWNRPPATSTFRIIFCFLDPLIFTVKDRMM